MTTATEPAEAKSAMPEKAAEAIDVSVVLPCLNEEETVAACVEKARAWFKNAGVRGEVIVVDNGSTDRSREEALQAGARVIDEQKRGYGAAHLRGFAANFLLRHCSGKITLRDESLCLAVVGFSLRRF